MLNRKRTEIDSSPAQADRVQYFFALENGSRDSNRTGYPKTKLNFKRSRQDIFILPTTTFAPPTRKNKTDQKFNSPRDWSVSASWQPILWSPEAPRVHHNTIVLRGPLIWATLYREKQVSRTTDANLAVAVAPLIKQISTTGGPLRRSHQSPLEPSTANFLPAIREAGDSHRHGDPIKNPSLNPPEHHN